jgi:hypothetical protein
MQQKFAEMFPYTHVPHCNAVQQLTVQFRETGPIVDMPRSNRPPVLTEEKIPDISGHIFQSPKSLFINRHRSWIPHMATHAELRKNLHLHPYKIISLHKLKERDMSSMLNISDG